MLSSSWFKQQTGVYTVWILLNLCWALKKKNKVRLRQVCFVTTLLLTQVQLVSLTVTVTVRGRWVFVYIHTGRSLKAAGLLLSSQTHFTSRPKGCRSWSKEVQLLSTQTGSTVLKLLLLASLRALLPPLISDPRFHKSFHKYSNIASYVRFIHSFISLSSPLHH